MKIRIILRIDYKDFKKGDEVYLEEQEALMLIQEGKAVYSDEGLTKYNDEELYNDANDR